MCERALHGLTRLADAAKRILILGEQVDLEQATCFEWDQIPGDLYPGDFDIVVLALESRASTKSIWHAGDGHVRMMFWRTLAIPGLAVVVITSLEHDVVDGVRPWEPWWLPFSPGFVRHRTTALADVHSSVRPYMDLVDEYPWYRDGPDKVPLVKSYIGNALPRFAAEGAMDIVADIKQLARNRAGSTVAFETRFRIRARPNGRWTDVGGRTMWLPPPPREKTEQAILGLLRDAFGIAITSAPPGWISDVSLPRQRRVEERLARLADRRAALETEIAELREQAEREGRLRGLLYTYGTELEQLVHDALGELGASLEPPRAARDDGRLVDPFGRRAILEIKGVEGTLRRAHLRELNDWTTHELTSDPDWEGKGILILNPQRAVAPASRCAFVPDDCERAARRFGQSILTTMQIFRATVDFQNGRFDARVFWDAVFDANALVSLPV